MLSGGERNRLLLARLFARPANLLVLDEPTNDLDIESLELLEQMLQDYPGTLLLVSHDRRFLDNVVTQTLAAEGDGALARVRRRLHRLAGAAATACAAKPERAATAKPDAPDREKAAHETELQGTARARRAAGRDRSAGARADRAQRAHEQRGISPTGRRHRSARTGVRLDEIETLLLEKFARWEALEEPRAR